MSNHTKTPFGCPDITKWDTVEDTKKFLKIIISNYNNYIYIKKCLDSIIEQTFKDYVIVIVDDASTDNSDKIIEIYSKRYPDKIKYIKNNIRMYPGGARNIGLKFPVESSYVYVMDSDDYLVDKNVLQKIYDNIKDNQYDALFFNYFIDYNGNLTSNTNRRPINLKSSSGCDPTCHWCSVIKTKCFSEYLENFLIGEDLVHQYKSMDLIQTYKNIPDRLYVYRNTKTQITSTNTIFEVKRRINDRIRIIGEMVKLTTIIQNTNIISNIKDRIHIMYKTLMYEFKKESYMPRILAMASFPSRRDGMNKVIQALHTQCDIMFIWLNNYNEIPKELFDYQNVVPLLAGKHSNVRENGRLYWINFFKNSYYITVDDDILYPNDYVKNICSKIDKYNQKCIVAYHGAIFKNGKEYILSFHNKLDGDTQIHRFGGGVAGFVPSKIGFECPEIEQMTDWDGDATISVWATQNGIKKICLERKPGYLKQLVINGKNIAMENALCLNNNTKIRRNLAYSKIKKWETLNPII